MSLYDIPDYEAALAALSVSNYINALKVSGEKCLQFHYSHLYHESFDKLPSPTLPFGIIRRVPCDAVVIFIAKLRKAMTPSNRERLCTCLSFPPNHAPDCPRSPGERLREAGIPTTTVSRLCMETHHDFCALYDCKCSCHERSTGQTEEETSEGTRCIHGVWLADHCYQCNGPNPAPLISQSASAPDASSKLSAQELVEAHAILTLVQNMQKNRHIECFGAAKDAIAERIREYASSSNAATLKELADFKQMSEYWETRYGNARRTWQQQINDEQNAHEKIAHYLIPLVGTADGTSVSAAERAAAEIEHLEAERDSLREARDEWKRQSLALVVLLKAKCSDEEWAGMNAKFDAALGDPK